MKSILPPLQNQFQPIACFGEKTSLYYWIQNNTNQKFGPVRVVRAQQIITISYGKTDQ